MVYTDKQREYNRRHREKNGEKLNERTRKWRAENREKYLEGHKKSRNRPEYIEAQKVYVKEQRITKPFMFAAQIVRHRAKLANLECEVTPEYLESIWTGICPVFGVEIFIGHEKGSISDLHRASIDRLDSTKGYTKDNIQFISFRANNIKTDASFEEFKKIYKWWKEIKDNEE